MYNPPRYLAQVPSGVLARGPLVIEWCARNGVERPTLADVAAERARRAGRPLPFRGPRSAPLPMPGPSPRYLGAARRNRERLRSVSYRPGLHGPFIEWRGDDAA